MSNSGQPGVYGNWTMPRSTGLAGQTTGVTLIGMGFIVIALIAGFVVNILAGLVAALVGALLMIPLIKSRGGRSGYEAWTLKRQYKKQRRKGEHVFRSGPFSRVSGGKYQLPGVLGTATVTEWETGGGQPFAMIHYPRGHQYTVVLRAFPQGSGGLDQKQIDAMVFHWGEVLVAFGQDGDVAGAEAVIESVPSTGIALRDEVRTLMQPDSPDLAQQIMVESAKQLGTQQVEMQARLTISFTATTEERRKSAREMSYEVSRRLMAMTPQLGLAGINVRPMREDEVVEVARRAYSPADQADLERGRRSPEGHGVSWDNAGPAVAVNYRRKYEHDGVTSSVWEMQDPPRGAVTERVLAALNAPNGSMSRKRINIVYRPHAAEEAAQLVESDFKNAMAATNSGRNEAMVKASASLRLANTKKAREEEALGHGLTRFGVILTVTEDAESGDIPRAEGLLKSLSVRSRLKIRRADWYQDLAFAAGLGLGVLLPDHASIPKVMAG